MTTPGDGDGGVSGQLLLRISSDVSSLVTDVAVIKSEMTRVSDHEKRIRDLEALSQQATGGRDTAARWWAAAGVVLAAGSSAAAWVAVAHH